MEEMADEQGRALDLKREKHLDVRRTLKNSEANLLKVRENLKEATKAKDSVEAGLAGAQKLAEDQTRRLKNAEEQLQIAKEQIVDLKKKLVEAEKAKNVAIWARDEAVRAKDEAEFARIEAKCSKEKAEEEAYDTGVAKTEAALKAQVPGVCRLYCSQVWSEALKRAGVDALSDLWKAECVFYPFAIREDATPSFEIRDALEGIEVASPSVAQETISPQVPAKGSDPSGTAGADKSQDPAGPKEAAGSISGGPVSHTERPVITAEPL